MTCKWCSSSCKKDGKQSNGTQKFRCRNCKRFQQSFYVYNACKPAVREQFTKFRTLGVSRRQVSQFLGISFNTVQKWIGKFLYLRPDLRIEPGGIYDIDEMQTYIGKRENKIWITYGWHINLKIPVGLHVGGRSSEDLKEVTESVNQLKPLKINTDSYPAYPGLIAKKIHKKGKRKANHIERHHRDLRKDIACLIRETMCFSRKKEMLEARLRWYFWGNSDPYFFLSK